MPTWLKVVLVMVGIGIAAVLAVGLGGYWWFSKNKDRLVEMGARAKADAEKFAPTRGSAECIDEAFVRLDAADGIMGEAEVRVFLEACLGLARPAPNLCDDVPSRSEIVSSAGWAISQCATLGYAGSQPCTRLLQSVQAHCERKGKAAGQGGPR